MLCDRVVDNWKDRSVLQLKDNKHIAEIKGHKNCVTEVRLKLESIHKKNKRNMSVQTELKELDLELDKYVIQEKVNNKWINK